MIVDYTEELGYSKIHVFRMGDYYTEKFVPYYFEPDPFGTVDSIFKKKKMNMIEKTYPKEVGRSRSPFSHEADILFPHRWILDRMKSINTDYSYLCIDIENSSRFMPKDMTKVNTGHSQVYSIALRYRNPWEDITNGGVLYLNPNPGKPLHIPKQGADYIEIWDDEPSLLQRYNEKLLEYDPDILTGWNFKKYDNYYLYHRQKKLGIKPMWGRHGKPAYLTRRGDISIWGRAIVDAQEMYRTKRRGIGRISWRLEYISKYENLKTPKTHLPGKGSKRYDYAWRHYPDQFANYNYFDVLAASELFEMDFPMYKTLQSITFQQIDRLFSQNSVTSSLLLRIAGKVRSPRIVLPTSKKQDIPRIKGADVFDPVFGYFENVHVPDYISYYPNIIKTYNMSTETIGGGCRLFNGHSFDLDNVGLLPEAIDYVLDERFKNKRLRDTFKPKSEKWEYYNLVQAAYKVAADGMYGAFKNNYFRLACRPVPESITYIGRQGIRIVKREAEKLGHTALRGDTDGVALVLKNGGIEDFVDNFHFSDFIGETCFGDIPQQVTIQLDKGDFYRKFYSVPEKKHYFYIDDNGHFGQKGYFKADLPVFAENFQTQIFMQILEDKGKFPQELYRSLKKDFMDAPLEDIGFPRKFPGGKDFRNAIRYAEEVLDLKFHPFDRPLSFNISSTGSYTHTTQIAVNDVDDIPNEFEINRGAMWKKLCGKGLGDTLTNMRSDYAELDWR